MRRTSHSRNQPNRVLIAAAIALAPLTAGAANVYVDSVSGSDGTGDGTMERPYGTITFAIEQSDDYDVLQLASGSGYSEAAGETFPS